MKAAEFGSSSDRRDTPLGPLTGPIRKTESKAAVTVGRRSRNEKSEYLAQRRKGRKEIELPGLAFLASWREKSPVRATLQCSENRKETQGGTRCSEFAQTRDGAAAKESASSAEGHKLFYPLSASLSFSSPRHTVPKRPRTSTKSGPSSSPRRSKRGQSQLLRGARLHASIGRWSRFFKRSLESRSKCQRAMPPTPLTACSRNGRPENILWMLLD